MNFPATPRHAVPRPPRHAAPRHAARSRQESRRISWNRSLIGCRSLMIKKRRARTRFLNGRMSWKPWTKGWRTPCNATCTHARIRARERARTSTRACAHARMHACTHARMHARPIDLYTYMYVRMISLKSGRGKTQRQAPGPDAAEKTPPPAGRPPLCFPQGNSGGTTCLALIIWLIQVFFKSGEQCSKLWWSLRLRKTHKTNEAELDK